jgi:undecaprenyl-diphosphatase
LEIGKMLLGPEAEAGGLTFSIVVHVATVLSTLVILWKEIVWILKGLLKFEWNEEAKYTLNILISMIPVGIVGLCFKEQVEALFSSNTVVGVCLLVTAALLTLTHYAKPRQREKISPLHAFIIGLAQAAAVLPGLSRSGSTIATGLLLGNSKQTLAQFSFLMVIPPILGEALLDFKDIFFPSAEQLAASGAEAATPVSALLVGFAAAFVSGCFACKWMISLVKKCKLIYFGIYCALAGLLVLILG